MSIHVLTLYDVSCYNESMSKRIAIYGRISTNDQKIDAQAVALERYCNSRGFEIVNRYFDEGISGAKKSRPQLDQLMADARRRKFDAVVVFRFDRFARSTRHLLEALEEFRALGLAFISITEAVDTTTPLGEALFTIVGAVGQLERNIIKERVKSGLAAAVSKGIKLGRPQKVNIQSVLELRRRNLSLNRIAQELKVSKSAVHKSLKEWSVKNRVPIQDKENPK